MALLTACRKALGRKVFQFEVTFAVYMFTAYEKFAFYSIVFLLLGLTSIAATLYLPHHISVLAGRVWYYINGDHIDVAASARQVVKELSGGVLVGLGAVLPSPLGGSIMGSAGSVMREL